MKPLPIDPADILRFPNKSSVELAEILGRRRDSIRRVAKRHGIALRPTRYRPTPGEVRTLSHLAPADIAKRVGCVPSTVRKVAAASGIDLPRDPRRVLVDDAVATSLMSPFWRKNLSRAVELHNAGLSTREIGEVIGVSKNAVVGAFHRAGLAEPKDDWKPKHSPAEMPGAGCCQYAHGDKPKYDFCGARVRAPGSAYCHEHHNLCYRPAREMEMADAAD